MKYIDFKNCVIQAAEAKGLAEYELYFTESEDVSTTAVMHQVQSYSTAVDAGACFRCIYQGKMGYASFYRSLDKKLFTPSSLHNKYFFNPFPHCKALQDT